MIGKRRSARIQNGVIFAAAQAQGYFTGHQRRNPAQNGLTQHQRLRIQPTPFIEQPAQLAAFQMVVGHRVLVVNRVEQALVGDPQQGHGGCLVDTARLGLNNAVLDLIGHTQAMPATDRVGFVHQRHRIIIIFAVDGHRSAGHKTKGHVFGLNIHRGVPKPNAHNRFHRLDGNVEMLQGFGLVGCAPNVGIS